MSEKFDFTTFYKLYDKLIGGQPPTKKFLCWLVGFAEGDGSWYYRSDHNRLQFSIDQEHGQLLDLIHKVLKIGKVRPFDRKKSDEFVDEDKPAKKTYYKFEVERFDEITLLILLFNGNLILNKTRKRFETWVNLYNQDTIYTSSMFKTRNQIKLKKFKLTFDFNWPWLTGFTEAEGNVYANLSYAGMNRRFMLSQNEKSILVAIRDNVAQKAALPVFREDQWIERAKRPGNYRLAVNNREALLVLKSYFLN